MNCPNTSTRGLKSFKCKLPAQHAGLCEFEFKPEVTPTGIPVLTAFLVRDRPYVVDVYGTLYQLQVTGDDPELWLWREFQRL
jgi:hypothetical protein